MYAPPLPTAPAPPQPLPPASCVPVPPASARLNVSSSFGFRHFFFHFFFTYYTIFFVIIKMFGDVVIKLLRMPPLPSAPAPPQPLPPRACLPACLLALLAKVDGAAATPYRYALPHECGVASADASRQSYSLSPCRVLFAYSAYSAPQLALVCDWLRELAHSCARARRCTEQLKW